MKPSSRAFVALWAANTILCVAAGYSVGARSRATPCRASRAVTQPAAPARAAAVASSTPSHAAPSSDALPPLVEGATLWTEPAPSRPTARRRGTLARPETGDPIPSVAPRTGARLQATRWLGRAPHVPLVAIDGERSLEYVGEQSCLPWSLRGARWRSVDAWGQFAGRATTAGGEGYAVTNCYELDLALTEGTAGSGLYVNEDSPWTPPPSARFEPTAEQQTALQRMLAQYDALHVRRFTVDGDAQRDDRRVMYFRTRDANGEDRSFAVIGGRSLLIARLEAREWRLVFQQRSSAHAGPSAFSLVAVFDMDRDGTPEVVVHHDEFDGGWDDVIYRSDDHGASWGESYQSVGGSTA
ncbi:MAG: hypothetical protein JNK05_39635 [Myxococcales bacterium]|nr:hypothetical protein [Myxococcales bacterium]